MYGATIAAAAALLSACAVGPRYVQPETPVAGNFTNLNPIYSNENGPEQFWTQFNDETLSRLVANALVANHDLRIALARFQEARAARGESRFDLAPTITASGGYTERRLAEVERLAPDVTETKLYDAGFDAFWELDFFGRVRRGIEARNAEVGAAEANLRDGQTIVIAEVARTYFELRGQQSQLGVAQRNVDNQTNTLKLTSARLDAGRGTELDTSRAQAQLSATLATIGPLEAAVARSIHRLSVLTGREPTALSAALSPVQELPALPEVVAVGNPEELLRRRPDIRVAERDLAASTARIGVAVADLFPKVTFVGSVGYASDRSEALGDSGTRTHLIAPSISWAALDLGRVRARIAGARANDDASLARYEQTVLRALEETEDALVTHAQTRNRLQHIAESERASRKAAQLAHARFDGGVIDFLEVLDAERSLLTAEDNLAQSRAATATTLVAVYKALGGGWQGAPAPRADKSRLTAVLTSSRR
jgi:multidrug efflux system outer membrane protein